MILLFLFWLPFSILNKGQFASLGANSLRVNPIWKSSESESEIFTGDTSKDNHSPGPVSRGVSP